MTFYEKNNVVETYLEQVENLLISNYHVQPEDAREAIKRSGLRNGLEGCPYIAMHYSPANTAKHIVADSLRDGVFHLSYRESHASV